MAMANKTATKTAPELEEEIPQAAESDTAQYVFDEQDAVSGGMATKRITAGRRTQVPGEIHLEKGQAFVAKFVGFRQPKGWKNAIAVFELNGELHRMNDSIDLRDKLQVLCAKNSDGTYSDAPAKPVVVQVTYQGEERTGPTKTTNLFRVIPARNQ